MTKVISAQDLAIWIRADLPQFYNTLAAHPNGEKWFNEQISWLITDILGLELTQ